MTIKGKVKWFNKKNGYGFIIPLEGDKEEDVFVHITTLQSCGVPMLTDGQEIEFTMVEGRNGKMAAETVSLISESYQEEPIQNKKIAVAS